MGTQTAMPKAQSLHLGLNRVDTAAYDGWDGPAGGLRVRRQRHGGHRAQQGHEADRAGDEGGRRAGLLANVRVTAESLKAGDLFFLTYSGHGGQVPDTDGDESTGRTRPGVSTTAS